MALKNEIRDENEFNSLPDVIKSEYKKVADGHYQLDVSGAEDIAPLKSALDKLKKERGELKATLDKIEADKRTAEDSAARASGDIAALDKSYQSKMSELERQVADAKAQFKSYLFSNLLEKTASEIAKEISNSPALMKLAIEKRLRVDDSGEEPTLRVLDAHGKVSALSLEDLKKELREDSAYAKVVIASKATGGQQAPSDANRPFTGGDASVDLTKLSPEKLVQVMKSRGI